MLADPVPLLEGTARLGLLRRLLGRPSEAPAPYSRWRISPSLQDPLQAVRVGSAEDTFRNRWSRHDVMAFAPHLGMVANLHAEGPGHADIDRVLLSKGQCAGLFFSNGLHAKVSDAQAPLEDEFKRQSAAWQALGAAVPEPLACGETPEGLRWLLSRRTDARAPQPQHLASRGGTLHPALAALLRQLWASPAPQPDIPNTALLSALESSGHLGTQAWPAQHRQRAQQLLAHLPHWPQHGDLWCGNIGRRGTLAHQHWVIFDWEDHGRLALPGLDMHLLQCSGVPLSPAAWHQALGHLLTPQDIALLAPVYEASSQWLRRHYAPSARANARPA